MSEQLISLTVVAARYDVSTRTIRRRVQARDGSVAPPRQLRPLKWREADINAHIARMSVAGQLQREARSA